MVKLVALYKKPENAEAFDAHYRDVHAPLIEKWPGLKRLEIGRVTGMPGGGDPPYYMIAEMHFDDREALRDAMRSPEGRAAGDDLQSFAA